MGQLKRNYVKIEGDMEELLENSKGEFQGGRIEVQNYNEVKAWRDNLKEIEDVFKLKGMESVNNE
ncbi:hypothetical protein [Fervidicella metallireducens]|nr:hypothetical protein [Fervidicella metallireducens]